MTIVERCIEHGLIDGELIACDGTYISYAVSKSSVFQTQVTIRKGMQSYLDALDRELEKEPGFKLKAREMHYKKPHMSMKHLKNRIMKKCHLPTDNRQPDETMCEKFLTVPSNLFPGAVLAPLLRNYAPRVFSAKGFC